MGDTAPLQKTRHPTNTLPEDVWKAAGVGEVQKVVSWQPDAGSLSRPSRWSKRRRKRFAIDGEEGPQGLIVRQDELEDAPDDQLPPRVGERRGS